MCANVFQTRKQIPTDNRGASWKGFTSGTAPVHEARNQVEQKVNAGPGTLLRTMQFQFNSSMGKHIKNLSCTRNEMHSKAEMQTNNHMR